MLSMVLLAALSLSFNSRDAKDGFEFGKPEYKSIGTLAFSPDGTLFFADSKGAEIYAVKMDLSKKDNSKEALNMVDVDLKLAEMMGTTTRDIRVVDMATNPVTKSIVLSVSKGTGNNTEYGLVSLTRDGDSKNGKLEHISLEEVNYSSYGLKDAPSESDKDRRGNSMRTSSITDIAFYNGEVYVTGISNEEFSSTFRKIPFPFKGKQVGSKIEIFHAAHGRFETNAPIRTFMPFKLDGKDHILAAYTCTPLVSFPVSDVKDGGHVMGKTVAELGSNNVPIDLVAFERGGKSHIVLSNSNRSAMRFDPADLVSQKGLKDPVEERFVSDGAKYVQLPLVQVLQLDDLNEDYIAVIQRWGNGSLRFRSLPKRWIADER